MADSMVALLIIALTLTLSFRALQLADRAGRRAEELRTANTLTNELMLRPMARPGELEGVTEPFAWKVRLQPTGESRPIALCRREAELVHVEDRRRYRASTVETCPSEPGV